MGKEISTFDDIEIEKKFTAITFLFFKMILEGMSV